MKNENFKNGVETLAKCLYSDDFHIIEVYAQIEYLKSNFIENSIDIPTINKYITGVIAYLKNEKIKKNLFYSANNEIEKRECAKFIKDVNTKIDFIVETLTNLLKIDWNIEIGAKNKEVTKDITTAKNDETIESLFKNNTKNIQLVIQLLTNYDVLNEDGELIQKKYHILAISEALLIKGIISKHIDMTTRNELLAKLFKTKIGNRTSRAKSVTEHDRLVPDYEDLFKNLKQ